MNALCKSNIENNFIPFKLGRKKTGLKIKQQPIKKSPSLRLYKLAINLLNYLQIECICPLLLFYHRPSVHGSVSLSSFALPGDDIHTG